MKIETKYLTMDIETTEEGSKATVSGPLASLCRKYARLNNFILEEFPPGRIPIHESLWPITKATFKAGAKHLSPILILDGCLNILFWPLFQSLLKGCSEMDCGFQDKQMYVGERIFSYKDGQFELTKGIIPS